MKSRSKTKNNQSSLSQENIHIRFKVALPHRSNISLRHTPHPVHQNRRGHTRHPIRHLRSRFRQRYWIWHAKLLHKLLHLRRPTFIDCHAHHRQPLRPQILRQTNQPRGLLPARPTPARPIVHQHHPPALLRHFPRTAVELSHPQLGHHLPLSRRRDPARPARSEVPRPANACERDQSHYVPDPPRLHQRLPSPAYLFPPFSKLCTV